MSIKNIPHDSAVTHVTGESLFIDDTPPVRGELSVGIFASPIASGRLTHLDYTEALEIPGVIGVYTSKRSY